MEDQKIVALYLERNEAAIEATKQKYGDHCFKIARNILTLPQDAEECVNDMYHHAWDSIPPNQPENLGAWLSRVVRNLALNLWNKNHTQKRYSGLTELLDEMEECIPSANLVEQEIEERELTVFLNKWLSSLPKEDRILFLRRYWNGERLKSLEEEYHMSHGKMAKRMYQLRLSLKETLEKEGYHL